MLVSLRGSMRWPRFHMPKSMVAALVIGMAVLVSACSLPNPPARSTTSKPPTATPTHVAFNATIRQENEQQGTANWVIPAEAQATIEI